MLKNRLLGLGLVVVASGCAWACGSDSDDTAPPAAGAGGTSGSSGSSGSSGAGTAGKGGSSGSGTAGTAGSGAAGTAGSGTAGTAGSGGQAGGGGEAGGSTADPVAQDATALCADQAALSCSFGASCVQNYLDNYASVMFQDEYAAMLSCFASKLSASDYECSSMSGGAQIWPAPKAGGACETELCTFSCDEGNLGTGMGVDENLFARCSC